MQGLLRAMTAVLAALLGFGLFAATQAAGAGADEPVAKREDSATVLVAHDDGDDDPDDESDDTSVGVSGDATNSRVTSATRGRDHSRGDLTRDSTMDGGDPTRDNSRHHTNDASRHDTR